MFVFVVELPQPHSNPTYTIRVITAKMRFMFFLPFLTVVEEGNDLLPVFRTSPSMISDEGKGKSMSKSRHTEAQMIGALKQLEAGRKAEDVAREVGVSKHTIYAWKAKYGGMDVSEAQEAKQLRDENTKLKKLVVDLSLDKEMLKALIAKNGWSS
jgi:putative transposase